MLINRPESENRKRCEIFPYGQDGRSSGAFAEVIAGYAGIFEDLVSDKQGLVDQQRNKESLQGFQLNNSEQVFDLRKVALDKITTTNQAKFIVPGLVPFTHFIVRGITEKKNGSVVVSLRAVPVLPEGQHCRIDAIATFYSNGQLSEFVFDVYSEEQPQARFSFNLVKGIVH